MRLLPLLLFIFLALSACCQLSFEGTLNVSYKNGSNISTADIKIKGPQVLIRQMENRIKKYNYFLVDLEQRTFETVALRDTMIVIKYHLDSLLQYYEQNNLKDGFRCNYGLALKETDKVVNDGAVRMVKAVGEDNTRKVTAWLIDEYVPLNELTPLLRLLGNWNEAESQSQKIVLQAEVFHKLTKRESSVKATYFKEKLPATLFELPKNALLKDFALLMQKQRNNSDLKTLIQTFAGF
ncbi:MAG: hypothetical protein IPH78_00805 [Bacteroidetes bacterium]|nr:hypothetical protein [Bacteroidota bacterium]